MEREMRADFKLTQALLGVLATAFFAWAGVVWNMNTTLEDALQRYQLQTLERFSDIGQKIAAQSIEIKHLAEEVKRNANN